MAETTYQRLKSDVEALKSGEPNPGEVERIGKKLADLKAETRYLSRPSRLLGMMEEIDSFLKISEEVCEQVGDDAGASSARKLRREALNAVERENEAELENIHNSAKSLFFRYYAESSHYWSGVAEYLRSVKHDATDPDAFSTCLAKLDIAIENSSIEDARQQCFCAFALLPESERKNTPPLVQPGLRL